MSNWSTPGPMVPANRQPQPPTMPMPTSSNHCLRYWDLADHIRIDDAIALWCGVEPAELAKLNSDTQCMSAKRAALITALRDGRLDYKDLGLLTGQGKVFRGAPVDELIEKSLLVIGARESLWRRPGRMMQPNVRVLKR